MSTNKFISFLVVGILFAANLHLSEAQLGVVYGGRGDNLPAPEDVVSIIKANNISNLRLLDENPEMLEALRGTNVEVAIAVNSSKFGSIGSDIVSADNWVALSVMPYIKDVKIKYIVAGNELSRNSQHAGESNLAPSAIANIQTSLEKQGIKDVKVTLSIDPSVMLYKGPNLAPSTTKLINESRGLLNAALPLLAKTGAPLMVSLFPYYEVVKHPNEIKPDFALFTATGNVLTDGTLGYQNKFDVMLDAYHTAVEFVVKTLPIPGNPKIEIIVSETGWPSAGGEAASLANEKTYITNLIQHLKKGTPKRPNQPIKAYIDMFDENKRGVPMMEKNFGVFTADKKIKFPVAFSSSA